jgi:SAM-dependent methyltransferase
MSNYYQKNYKAYHEKTFSIDPSSFLAPLAQRLSADAFVLDVGCGSGRDLLWMKKRGFDVIGFERSPGLAELARDNAACEVMEGDFESYDFSSILSRIFHESILLQPQGVDHEAVVCYREWATTQQML